MRERERERDVVCCSHRYHLFVLGCSDINISVEDRAIPRYNIQFVMLLTVFDLTGCQQIAKCFKNQSVRRKILIAGNTKLHLLFVLFLVELLLPRCHYCQLPF